MWTIDEKKLVHRAAHSTYLCDTMISTNDVCFAVSHSHNFNVFCYHLNHSSQSPSDPEKCVHLRNPINAVHREGHPIYRGSLREMRREKISLQSVKAVTNEAQTKCQKYRCLLKVMENCLRISIEPDNHLDDDFVVSQSQRAHQSEFFGFNS